LFAGETRFGTAFIMLDSLIDNKEALRASVVSPAWDRQVSSIS
jgi:hypothetical protein